MNINAGHSLYFAAFGVIMYLFFCLFIFKAIQMDVGEKNIDGFDLVWLLCWGRSILAAVSLIHMMSRRSHTETIYLKAATVKILTAIFNTKCTIIRLKADFSDSFMLSVVQL